MDKKIKEFLEDLGLKYTLGSVNEDGTYLIHLRNSDDFSSAYVKLDSSDLVTMDIDSVVMNENSNEVTYVGDDFVVFLKAEFNENKYTLTIEDNE